MMKNILIVVFIVLGMIVVLNYSEHNFKRAVDAGQEVKNYLKLK